jgi:hypothetical protein
VQSFTCRGRDVNKFSCDYWQGITISPKGKIFDEKKEALLYHAKLKYPIGTKILSEPYKDILTVITEPRWRMWNCWGIKEALVAEYEQGYDIVIYGIKDNIEFWAEIVEDKKQVVEVEIPEGYKVKDIQKCGEGMRTVNGITERTEKSVDITFESIKSCKTCLFNNRGMNIKPCNKWIAGVTEYHCEAHQDKSDLSNTKIRIGDNPKLSELVQKKAFELGWKWHFDGK